MLRLFCVCLECNGRFNLSIILDDHPTFTVGGVPVAVDDCQTECGCKLIGSGSASVG
ncbi:PAAR domain-containing protein [Collimonas arenae]|uniref:PAAR domain-containing protein n=1 Tax=Collimonas arenae TaxID=279058 RepID=UPI0012E03139|nr:PAAR domain-containing protein [Collimonas arenae]